MTPAERIQAVIDMVLAEMPASRAELIGSGRAHRVVLTRELVACVLHTGLELNQRVIAGHLRCERSTVSVMIYRAANRRTTDPQFDQLAARLVAQAEELFA